MAIRAMLISPGIRSLCVSQSRFENKPTVLIKRNSLLCVRLHQHDAQPQPQFICTTLPGHIAFSRYGRVFILFFGCNMTYNIVHVF